ncbi:hypothetical protein G6F55_014647 [Rhizopus delemar]|nr:hypothetical protein G6F55_014647 [Rhizopus delemar]
MRGRIGHVAHLLVPDAKPAELKQADQRQVALRQALHLVVLVDALLRIRLALRGFDGAGDVGVALTGRGGPGCAFGVCLAPVAC